MENSVLVHRLYLKEPMRKHLGINLKNKKIYYFKLKNRMYLSTDVVPKNKKILELKAQVGMYQWFVDIPAEHLTHLPTNYKLLNTLGKVLELV